ncbi:MAG: AAA family ATPase [Bacteroidia bacterium]|nr:AAA family ATPase [Bacteroidia bacterium]
MLIRFIASNFLSFREPVEFNMLTGDIRRFPHHVHKAGQVEVLKAGILYGANGAGKSNLVRAIETLRNIARWGLEDDDYRPFKLQASQDRHPARLEMELLAGDTSYLYGVKFLNGIICSEWLARTRPGKPDVPVFTRTRSESGSIQIEVQAAYRRRSADRLRIRLYEQELLADEMSLLRMLAQAKEAVFEETRAVYGWFDRLEILFPDTRPDDLVDLVKNPERQAFYEQLMASLHTGVSGLEIERIPLRQYLGEHQESKALMMLRALEHEEFVPDADTLDPVLVTMEDGQPVARKLTMLHTTDSGATSRFSLQEESDGTQRLFEYAGMLYGLLREGRVYVIDEIERSIHPVLIRELLGRLLETAGFAGQLILTTHESQLLDQELFRQDEIWFAEKQPDGATSLYPLSDFEIRTDLDIRKGYLSGRFGAIPFLGNLRDLNWKP